MKLVKIFTHLMFGNWAKSQRAPAIASNLRELLELCDRELPQELCDRVLPQGSYSAKSSGSNVLSAGNF